jgi:hypothetical protein
MIHLVHGKPAVAIGNIGDYALDADNAILYGPKTGAADPWASSRLLSEVPAGGTTNQVLGKASGDDSDVEWQTLDEDNIHCDAYGHSLTTLHAILADIDSRLTALEPPP